MRRRRSGPTRVAAGRIVTAAVTFAMLGLLPASAWGADPPNPADSLPHAAPVPLVAGDDWPLYGHDLSNTRAGSTNAPSLAQAPDVRPVWTFESTNGDFTGTPVESGGTLVALSTDGSVFALDASTGKLLWERDLGQAATASPAIDGGHVFVPLATEGSPEIVALSLSDGSVQWSSVIDTDTGSDTYGSPVVWNGMVIMGTSGANGDAALPLKGSVVALDESTGALVWRTYTVGDPSSTADAVANNGGAVWSTPAIDTATGDLYVGTGNAYTGTAAPTTDAILKLNASTGQILGYYQATSGDDFSTGPGGQVGVDADLGSSPNLFTGPNGEAMVGEGSKNGTYYALDRNTMKLVWSTPLGAGSAVGGILGSTAYDGTHLYGPVTIGAEQWALNPADGTPAWVSSDGGPLHWASTSVANGIVYDSDMSEVLTMRDAATGAVVGKLPLGGEAYGGVALAGGYVFAVTGTQSATGWIDAYRADPSALP
jgi:polyvinyl alcohol dehydrogenase (cytochrome)